MVRPREHNRDDIAEKLLKWAQKPDSINLNKFCALNFISPSKLSFWAKEEDNFRIFYEIAKSYIAFRREEMLNENMLHVKGYDLNASTYDYFLREERRQQSEFENSLKIKEIQSASQECIDKYDAFMNQLEEIQESAFKRADNNINNET